MPIIIRIIIPTIEEVKPTENSKTLTINTISATANRMPKTVDNNHIILRSLLVILLIYHMYVYIASTISASLERYTFLSLTSP